MRKIKKRYLFFFILLFICCFSYSDSILLKNVSLFLSDGHLQNNSYLIIEGKKISDFGLMEQIPNGKIFDIEKDLENHIVYPAFIDSYNYGYQKIEKKDEGQTGRQSRSFFSGINKNERTTLEERNFFIKRKAVDYLEVTKSNRKKAISKGFVLIHVVPENGIITGHSTLISLVSDNKSESVLNDDLFLNLRFIPNKRGYPVTYSGIIKQLEQLKIDAEYYKKMRKVQYYHKSKRAKYRPELEEIYPFFNKKGIFIVETKDYVTQRMFEILNKSLKIETIMVGNPEIWRREVSNSTDIIIPLSFTPPISSKYSNLGDRFKKEAEKQIYPSKIADFIKTRKNIVLTPPASDYSKFHDNIKELIKRGVEPKMIINALTINPAKILGVSDFIGKIEKGLLANLIITEGELFKEKSKIKKVFVEGKLFDFSKMKKGEKPVADLTGNWLVRISGPMGNFDLKMKLVQEGNYLEGKLTSAMGVIEIEEGNISGKQVVITASAPIGGQSTAIYIEGEYDEGKIKGTVSLGSFGQSNFTASPENKIQGGLK